MREPITFRPLKLETVVVMRGDKPIGTIKRYRAHRACIVSVPGILSAAANPGQASFPNIGAAKAAIIAKDNAGE